MAKSRSGLWRRFWERGLYGPASGDQDPRAATGTHNPARVAFAQHVARPLHGALLPVLVISVLAFFLSLVLFIGAIVYNPAAPQGGAAMSQCMPLPVSAVGVSWQDGVQAGGSEVIGLTLVSRLGTLIPTVLPAQTPCPTATPTALPPPSPTPTPTKPGPTPTPTQVRAGGGYAALPHAIGTPGPLEQAFGPKYDGYASAQLQAIGFDAIAPTPGLQSLDQTEIDWDWNVSPKNSGKQYAVVTVDGIWKPKSGSGQA